MIVLDGDNWAQPLRSSLRANRLQEFITFLAQGRQVVDFLAYFTRVGEREQFYINGFEGQLDAAGVRLVFLDPVEEQTKGGETRSRGYEDESIFEDIKTRAQDFDSLIIISGDADFTILGIHLILRYNKRIEVATAVTASTSKYLLNMADTIHNIDSFIPVPTPSTA